MFGNTCWSISALLNASKCVVLYVKFGNKPNIIINFSVPILHLCIYNNNKSSNNNEWSKNFMKGTLWVILCNTWLHEQQSSPFTVLFSGLEPPQKYPFHLGIWTPILLMVLWFHMSLCPKWHLDWVSCFCTIMFMPSTQVTVSWRSDGGMFQAAGPEQQKPHSLNLVLVESMIILLQPFNGPLSGTVPVSRYQKKHSYPLTPNMIINHPLSAFFIYYDPQHPPCSFYVLGSLCTTSLQVLFGLPLGLAPFASYFIHDKNEIAVTLLHMRA